MPLTRSALQRLHLQRSASPDPCSSPQPPTTTHPDAAPAAAVALDESISSTLVSDRTQDSSSSASSSSDDDDDDSEEDDSDSDSPASEDTQPDPTAHLSALLARAKQAARDREQQAKAAKAQRAAQGGDDVLAGNDEVVLFGIDDEDDDEEEEEEDADKDSDRAGSDARDSSTTPRASTSRGGLPPSLARPLSRSHPLLSSSSRRSVAPTAGGISLAQDVGGVLADGGATRVQGTARTAEVAGKGKGKEVQDRWGQAPLPPISKKQLKAKQPHTAGAAWFDMPATPMTPQLKRELDALRLSQALDPKRFMRGGAKRDKVGEFFQIGHIVAPSTRATTLASAPRVQKRSFVEELIQDEEAKAYARKKTKEVLAKTMSGRKRQRKGGKGAHAMGAGSRK